MKLSESITNFLSDPSYKGVVWLNTTDGRLFLQKEEAIPWLLSNFGQNWLLSDMAKEWLFNPETDFGSLLGSFAGTRLLENESARNWLTQSEKGKKWLISGEGHKWLSTEAGRSWVESPQGQRWLDVPAELLELVKNL